MFNIFKRIAALEAKLSSCFVEAQNAFDNVGVDVSSINNRLNILEAKQIEPKVKKLKVKSKK